MIYVLYSEPDSLIKVLLAAWLSESHGLATPESGNFNIASKLLE